MDIIESFRKYAATCDEMARLTNDRDTKAHWRDLAFRSAQWIRTYPRYAAIFADRFCANPPDLVTSNSQRDVIRLPLPRRLSDHLANTGACLIIKWRLIDLARHCLAELTAKLKHPRAVAVDHGLVPKEIEAYRKLLTTSEIPNALVSHKLTHPTRGSPSSETDHGLPRGPIDFERSRGGNVGGTQFTKRHFVARL